MPALLILGYEMELGRIMVVAVLGGLLGVLMMIPMRYALIVKSHGELVYPEGTACAEVLLAGEKGGSNAKTVFSGFFFGLIYKFLNLGLKLWNDVPDKALGFFKGASVSAEVSPELLGVGYIIGPRISCIMVAGGILSSWVLIPMIKLFGEGLKAPLFPGTKLISEMGLDEVWHSYVLYIGAGAVAAGGIISLFQSLPTIIHGAVAGMKGLKSAGERVTSVLRTEQDIPLKYVLIGSLALVVAITLAPALKMNLLGAILIVAFGFLFVTVSSRLTGEIGSSSNPISGMTVATLLLTSLVFLLLGWTSPLYRVTALSVAAIVCVAASNGGTTSQDLKTGYLVGATPYRQQVAMLVGALTSAIVIGWTLNVLNDATTVFSQKHFPKDIKIANVADLTEMEKPNDPVYASDTTEYHVLRLPKPPSEGPLSKLDPGKYLVDDSGSIRYFVDPGINGILKTRDDGTLVQRYKAPKAQLMSLIIDGILTRKLPWGLVLLGVSIALVLELCGIASLPFAVGVYLPLSSSSPIFFGGMVRWLVEKFVSKKGVQMTAEEAESGPGILFSSGLIAGGSICGIALAILSVKGNWGSALDMSGKFPVLAGSDWTSVVVFGVMLVVLFLVGNRCRRSRRRAALSSLRRWCG